MNGNFGGVSFLILALAGAGVAVALFRLLWRLGKIAAELEVTARNLNHLSPRLERFMDTVETEITALHAVTARVDRITAGIEGVSTRAVAAADTAISRVDGFSSTLRSVGAAAAGLAAGLRVFGRGRRNGPPPDDSQPAATREDSRAARAHRPSSRDANVESNRPTDPSPLEKEFES